DNGQLLGQTTVKDDGSWCFNCQGLNHGEHNFSASGAGANQTANLAITVDPNASNIDLPPGTVIYDGGKIDNNTPTIEGWASPGAIISLSANGYTYGPIIADNRGRWTIEVSEALPQGEVTFAAMAELGGGQTFYFAYTLEVDAPQPALSSSAAKTNIDPSLAVPDIESVQDNVGIKQGVLAKGDHSDDDIPTLLGQAEAWSEVQIFDNGVLLGSTYANANGRWTYSPTTALPEGEHSFTAVLIDLSGNRSETSDAYTIIVDRTIHGPQLLRVMDDSGQQQTTIANGGDTLDARPEFIGKADPNDFVTIIIDGSEVATVQADTNGNWRYELQQDLSDGSHSMQAYSYDLASNYSATSTAFNFNVIGNRDIGPVTDSDANANRVSEFAPLGQAVGITAAAIDPDATDTVTYRLLDDAGGRFQIDPNTGVVTVAGQLNYDIAQAHQITVQANSSDGSSSQTDMTINVDLVNRLIGPLRDSNSGANTVLENAGRGTAVGITALAVDPDNRDSVSYQLLDNAGGRFQIDANTGVVTVAGQLDYNSAQAHQITVLARSSDGSSSQANMTIEVQQVNRPIGPVSDVDGAANQVSEYARVGSAVGITALATDPDAGDTVSYQLLNNAGGRFQIDAQTGVVRVAGKLDYETGPRHQITVQANSSDGSSSRANMDINLINEQYCMEWVSVPPDLNNIYTSGRNFLYVGKSNAPAGTVLTIKINASAYDYVPVNNIIGKRYVKVGESESYRQVVVGADGGFQFYASPLLQPTLNSMGAKVGQAVRVYIASDHDRSQPDPDSCTLHDSTRFENRDPRVTPLVLDLNGDGVNTTALAQGVSFDLDADGVLDQSAWSSAEDGLLVRDINGDGKINDGSELFGSYTQLQNGEQAEHGFAALADLDSNGDGLFDAADQHYTELQVWVDGNSDGQVQAGELQSLLEAGVAQIDLGATAISETNAGNWVGLRSSWTDTEGQQHDIDDVWFSYLAGAAALTAEQQAVIAEADIFAAGDQLLDQLSPANHKVGQTDSMSQAPALSPLPEQAEPLSLQLAPELLL
ncbi:MAG: cadherin domain-containing protein, partial [Cellvibrionaceae bacterium]|nr:cadherin domain-containing protein [Cellvibrionaceae bacterium]